MMNPIAPNEAVSVARHFHRLILGSFILGYVLHAMVQVSSLASNKKCSILSILEQSWPKLALRLFISACAFVVLWKQPDALATLLGLVGLPASKTTAALTTIPIVPATAGLFGVVMDTLLTFVPYLKSIAPPVDVIPPEAPKT